MNKAEDLITLLKDGWCAVPALTSRFGWQAHTLRGAISTLAKKHGLKIDRERVDGITCYRIAPTAPYTPAPDTPTKPSLAIREGK